MPFDPTILSDDPRWEPATTPDEIAAAMKFEREMIQKRLSDADDPPAGDVDAGAEVDMELVPSKSRGRIADVFRVDSESDVYSVDGSDNYVVQRRIDGRRKWIRMGRGQLGSTLAVAGYSRVVPKGGTYSAAEKVAIYADTFNSISGCGSVAGHQPGIVEFPGGPYAVTRGYDLPDPGAPDPYIGTLIRHMLMDAPDAYDVLMGWLHRFYVSLRDGGDAPGQILALLGPPGTGKTWLIEQVIARLFGGRVAKPFTWLSGETRFNDDVVGAELQVIDDEQCPGDRRTRKSIGSRLKQMIGAATIRVEAKGQKPVSVCPRWRLVFGANDEAGAMNVFPEGTSDMEGKICFLEIPDNPIYTFPGKYLPRAEFDGMVDAAFGGFVREVIDFELPAHLVDERWGVIALRTSDAVAEMDEKDAIFNRTDDERLEGMLRILAAAEVADSFEISAAELINSLSSNNATRDNAKHVLAGCPGRTGRLLSKIAKRTDAVVSRRTTYGTKWAISLKDSEPDTEPDTGDFTPF